MNKVTIEQVNALIKNTIVRTETEFGKPVTYVAVELQNGFTMRESTTCVDPSNYSEEIGKEICLERIEDKIWFVLGYQLQEKIGGTPKDRVIRELTELNEKIDKLNQFITTNPFFQTLADGAKKRLEEQVGYMLNYAQVLKERLEKDFK